MNDVRMAPNDRDYRDTYYRIRLGRDGQRGPLGFNPDHDGIVV